VKYFPHFLLFFAPLFCYSQEVVSSGGEQFSNAEGSFTFTIGEPVIETFTGTENILTQGFQQNYEAILSVSSIPFSNIFSIYPNPFNDVLIIDYSKTTDKAITVSLQDLNGKVIMTKIYSSLSPNNSIELLLSDLSDGLYLLNIIISNDLTTTYRVVKTN
jgi:hypothetical protein